jgi:hypothetical protein
LVGVWCPGFQTARAQGFTAEVPKVSLPSMFPTAKDSPTAFELFSTLGNVDLYRITGGVFLPDGTLAVANAGSHEIVFLADDGELARRYGREGDGPGEFHAIRAIGLTPEGRLWAYDDALGRLTEIPDPGGAARTRPLRPADRITSLEPLTVVWDGPVVAIRGEHRMFRMSGESRDTVPLFRFSADGESIDTLGTWPGLEKSFAAIGNGSAQLQVGFGRDLETGANSRRSVLGSTDSLALSVYDTAGRLEMKVVGPGASVEVTESAAEAWRDERMVGVPEDYPQLAAAYGEVRVHSTYPAFDGLALDRADRIWVGLHPNGGDAQLWWIVGDRGVERAVTVPSGGAILAVDGERMALLRRTELGEEYVVVYRVAGRDH